WLGLAAILAAALLYDSRTPFPGTAALLPCAGTALVIWSNAASPTAVGRLLSLPAVVFVGLISYSLYLWHWPILVFTKYWSAGEPTVAFRVGVLAACFAAAALSWRLVETPFRRRRVLPQARGLFAFCAAGFAVVLCCGVLITQQHGVRSRFSPEVLAYADGETETPFFRELSLDDARKGRFTELGGNKDGPVECLLWGDSHAMAVAPVVAQLCKDHAARAVAATHSSTAPLLGYESRETFGLKDD